ncbi:MAG TPA: DUF1566 domain-containing protein [Thermoanaerobaculia bacterium]|nr:DUF1566 domain-containing protein [Thermoanaerobaculia bacterium]
MVIVAFVLLAPGMIEAQLAPPAGPNDAASARFTLGDVYQRLLSGAAGVKRGATFTEPAAGPTAAASKTTDEIMAVAPAADNVNGATAADVAAGKTFWGLRTSGGTWGLTTGSGTIATYPAPVAKTGQTQCYKFDGTNWVIDTDCATNTPANQDGKLRKGVAWPNPRFTKNGNGTVTDNLTGLIWLEDGNCTVFYTGDATGQNSRNWTNAMTAANSLASGACGLTDGSTAGQWRLPNVKELLSLIDYAYEGPALSNTAGTGKWKTGDPFSWVKSDFYWSSTASTNNSAYYVHFWGGWTEGYGRTLSYAVWPVRDGQ